MNMKYVIDSKTYEKHINEEVHLYGLLHQLAFLAGKVKDDEDVAHLTYTAQHYGDIADEKFDSWGIPGRYLVFGDRADLKELKETELEPLTAVLKAHDREQEEKASVHDSAYIISGSSFRMLVHDLFDLLVLYGSLRNQIMKLEREVQLKRLRQKLEKDPLILRRMYHKWGIPGENGVTALDMMQEGIAKHHLKPYPMGEPEQVEDFHDNDDDLDADILCYSDFFEDDFEDSYE